MKDDETSGDGVTGTAATLILSDPWTGRVVDGRYRILERLGQGGMGAVFLAEHVTLCKRVALKIIHGQLSGNDEVSARFVREAMTSAQLEHPNVVSALDFGTLPEGGSYLVMQLVHGPSLRTHLAERGPLPYAAACAIAAQIADALTAAHAAGIVHRDLKPDNVVLMPDEQGVATVKVLDFGIAHVKAHNVAPAEARRQLTRVGTVIGTPGYMPPEQATGQAIDERADLYALGVILWELLMAKRPFVGESLSAIVTRQLSAPAPELDLSTVCGLPDELSALVRSLLERAPADRADSASAVRDKLRALSSLNGPAPSLSFPVSGRKRYEGGLANSLRTAARWPQRDPVRLRVSIVALVLALIVVAWRWSGSTTEGELPASPTAAAVRTEAESAPVRPANAPGERKASDDKDEQARRALAPRPSVERSRSAASAEPVKRKAHNRKGRSGRQRSRPGQRIRRMLGGLID